MSFKEKISHSKIPRQQMKEVRQKHPGDDYIRNRRSPCHEKKWEGKFQQLLAYKKKFGHFKISTTVKEYKPLFNWLGKQREGYKNYKNGSKGALRADQISRLESVGVSLEPYSKHWNERFGELKVYQEQYGHCNVPQQGSSSYVRLGQWLARQKTHLRPSDAMRQGHLSFTAQDLKRARFLESLGVQL